MILGSPTVGNPKKNIIVGCMTFPFLLALSHHMPMMFSLYGNSTIVFFAKKSLKTLVKFLELCEKIPLSQGFHPEIKRCQLKFPNGFLAEKNTTFLGEISEIPKFFLWKITIFNR
jgi:hypothetical protein